MDHRKQISEWLIQNHPKKFEDQNRNVIVEIIFKWLSQANFPDNIKDNSSPTPLSHHNEHLDFNTYPFRLLDEYLSKPEFFVYLGTKSIIYEKFNYHPVIVSLCESESGLFKYLHIVKKMESITFRKFKFKVCKDGKIHDLSRKKTYNNYDDMIKYLITHECYDHQMFEDPREIKISNLRNTLIKRLIQKDLLDNKIIYYFISKNTSEIIFNDGSMRFLVDELSNWSNTISNMMLDSCVDETPIQLYVTKEIFVIYALFRISIFFQYNISPNILNILSEKVDGFPFTKEQFNIQMVIKHIISLYRFCDYMEDNMAMAKLIDIFRENVSDKYERQRFYDILFSYQKDH